MLLQSLHTDNVTVQCDEDLTALRSVLCDAILKRRLLQPLCQQSSPYALHVHLAALNQLQECVKAARQGEGRKQAEGAALGLRHLKQAYTLILICSSMLDISRQRLSLLTTVNAVQLETATVGHRTVKTCEVAAWLTAASTTRQNAIDTASICRARRLLCIPVTSLVTSLGTCS